MAADPTINWWINDSLKAKSAINNNMIAPTAKPPVKMHGSSPLLIWKRPAKYNGNRLDLKATKIAHRQFRNRECSGLHPRKVHGAITTLNILATFLEKERDMPLLSID